MSLSHNKITQLPTALQSHILSSIAPSSRCNIEPSLDAVCTRREKLPRDLLSVAQSSRALSEATADALGVRAQILNRGSAHPLSEWIAALGKSVRAVSLHDFDTESLVLSQRISESQDYFDKLFQDALDTFKALTADDITLHVLDVKALPFPKYKKPEVLTEALSRAVERSSQSLRELGLRLTPICVNGISRANLPNLNIVEVKYEEIEDENHIHNTREEKIKAAFMSMFRALEGHADRKANKTTLSELRLTNVLHAPCVDAKDACTGLFQTIQTLKVHVINSGINDNSVAKFFTLFPNLRSLHWNGVPTVDNLRMIHSACPKLEELFLSPNVRYTFSLDSSPSDASKLTEVFVACQGKLRALNIELKLTMDQMRVLGESSPALQQLTMEIGPENIDGLSLLLGTRCRQLKDLNLSFSPDAQTGLNDDEWREFTEAIRSASDELCEVSIIADDDRDPVGHAHEAMLQSILEILEILGERPCKLRFEVPIPTMNMRVLFEGYCKVIDACVTHSKKLERLVVIFHPGEVDVWFHSNEELKFWCEKLLRDMKKLRELPELNHVDFGGMDTSAAEQLEEWKAEVNMGSNDFYKGQT